MNDTIDTRIDRGVAWLDANVPDWLDRIDLDTLDISSGCNCVLGQTFADMANEHYHGNIDGYEMVVDGYGAAPDLAGWPGDYGFAANADDHSFCPFTEAWVERITALRLERAS